MHSCNQSTKFRVAIIFLYQASGTKAHGNDTNLSGPCKCSLGSYHKLPPWWIVIFSVEPLKLQQMIGLIPGVLPFYQTTLYVVPHSKRNFDYKSDFKLTMGPYNLNLPEVISNHDDVIKWKHFPRYWSFVWGIHRSPGPVNSPHKASDAELWCFLWFVPE